MTRKTEISDKNIQIKNIIVTISLSIAIFALFVWLIVTIGSNYNVEGNIVADNQTICGVEQTFAYNNDKLKRGDVIEWYVNNNLAEKVTYDGQNSTLKYTPTDTGTLHVIAKVCGKYYVNANFDVIQPRLTVTAPSCTIVYGDPLPQMCATCTCDIDCSNVDLSVDVDKLTVGSHVVQVCHHDYDGLDVTYNNGIVTVLPRIVEFDLPFVKTYDGTNNFATDVQMNNIVNDDDVKIVGVPTYTCTKVGLCLMDTSAIRLEGEDSYNYVLPDNVAGNILPKTVTLDGLKICDKHYDGTDKATIEKLGTLTGIVDGDSVAIGTIDARFDNAEVGTHNIVISDVTLVGYDKNNYTFEYVGNVTANITE